MPNTVTKAAAEAGKHSTEEKTVVKHISDLRKWIKEAYSLPAGHDPIRSAGSGKDCVYWLEMPVR